MPPRARIQAEEFAIIRRYFMEVGPNWQLIVIRTRQELPGAPVQEVVKEIWRANTDRQLRRRVREAVQSRVNE